MKTTILTLIVASCLFWGCSSPVNPPHDYITPIDTLHICDSTQAVELGGYSVPEEDVKRNPTGCVRTIRTSAYDLEGLEYYAGTLETLEIYFAWLYGYDRNLDPIARCTNLIALRFNSCMGMDTLNLGIVATLTKLEEFSIITSELRNIDLTPLYHCVNLTSLSLNGNYLDYVELSGVASCTLLQTISIGDNSINYINLSPLSQCKKLQSLYLFNNHLTSVNLTPLQNLENLKNLYIGDNRLTYMDLTPLSGCSSLQYLFLSDNEIPSIDLSPLSACSNLQGLYLSRNSLNAISPAPLETCANLRVFLLNGNYLDSVSCAAVTTFANEHTDCIVSSDCEGLFGDFSTIAGSDFRLLTDY
jgi:hypothetical protein